RVSGVQLPIAHLVARELGLRLRNELAVSALVAWREVEYLQPAHSRGSRPRARPASGPGIAPARLIAVALPGRRLAEEYVGALRQAHDADCVGRREEHVDDVGDLLSRRHDEQLVAQRAEGPAIAGSDLDGRVGGRAGADRVLEHVEPGTGAEPGA